MEADFNRIVILGAGRLAGGLSPALSQAGFVVHGPLHRNEFPGVFDAGDVVLLCLPDHAIADVASRIAVGPLVGHCSGALALDVLGAHEGFSAHPLLSVTGPQTVFRGAACAIAGRTERGMRVARQLAEALEMDAITIPDELRPLYHAAASMASNYLVTIEDAAEQLSRTTGVRREHLAILARSALTNWTKAGAASLTGPIARGDEETIVRQRRAVSNVRPDLVPMWDALVAATRDVATRLQEENAS
jgi:predicted short-subunit dehydrogenase-like oxidoreductase (DUF2520 family)